MICWKFRAWKTGLRTKAGGRERVCYHTLLQNLASSDPETTKKRLRDTHQWLLRSCSHSHSLCFSLHIHYCCCDVCAAAADWKPWVLWLSWEQFCQSWQCSFAWANTITSAAGQLLFQLVLWHMCSLTLWEPTGNHYPQGIMWKPNPSLITCACSAPRNTFTVASAACGHGLILPSGAEGIGTAAPPPHGFPDFPD